MISNMSNLVCIYAFTNKSDISKIYFTVFLKLTGAWTHMENLNVLVLFI